MDGLIRMRELLPLEELALHDLNEERLAILAGLTRRMFDRGGHPARLTATARL